MKLIDNINSQAYQVHHIVLDDATVVDLTLRYLPTIQRWSFDVTYDGKTVAGNILCQHPNLLRQWIKVWPFGMACAVTDGTEPTMVDDFENGRALLYILTGTDMDYVEESVIGA